MWINKIAVTVTISSDVEFTRNLLFNVLSVVFNVSPCLFLFKPRSSAEPHCNQMLFKRVHFCLAGPKKIEKKLHCFIIFFLHFSSVALGVGTGFLPVFLRWFRYSTYTYISYTGHSDSIACPEIMETIKHTELFRFWWYFGSSFSKICAIMLAVYLHIIWALHYYDYSNCGVS